MFQNAIAMGIQIHAILTKSSTKLLGTADIVPIAGKTLLVQIANFAKQISIVMLTKTSVGDANATNKVGFRVFRRRAGPFGSDSGLG